MTNLQIIEWYRDLRELDNLPLPISVSYAIARNREKMRPIVFAVENLRDKLVQDYGVQSESDPAQYDIPEENRETLGDKLNELSYCENADLQLTKFPLYALTDISITPKQMNILLPMISEED